MVGAEGGTEMTNGGKLAFLRGSLDIGVVEAGEELGVWV